MPATAFVTVVGSVMYLNIYKGNGLFLHTHAFKNPSTTFGVAWCSVKYYNLKENRLFLHPVPRLKILVSSSERAGILLIILPFRSG